MSYTETHAVTSFYECKTCQVTISGDHIPENLVEMIYAHHEGHDFGPASPFPDGGEGLDAEPAGPENSNAAA